MKSMYFKKEAYFVDMFGKVKCNQTTLYNDRNNCFSRSHVEKWLSINDLLNVAHFLNNGWTPNWDNNDEQKHILVLKNKDIAIQQTDFPTSIVYFSSADTAREAINVLGAEKLSLILQG